MARNGPTPEAVRREGSHYLARGSPWVARIVAAAALRPGESVLDAGAGAGSLTAPVAAAVQPGGSVLAVEKDAAAAAALRRLDLPGVRILEADMLRVRLPEPLDAVVANPPFRLLPALLRRLLAHGFGRAVLVMPQELADRLVAQPKSEAYGRLTVEVGMRAKPKVLFPLPRSAFDPPPAVPCAVVHLHPRPGPPPADTLPALLDAAWGAPQRTFRHSLAALGGPASPLGLSPQEVSEALAATATRDRTAREVSPWECGELARLLAAARTGRQAPGRHGPEGPGPAGRPSKRDAHNP